MGTHITKEAFESMYNETYKSVLKYVICHCRNLDDVNDIIQDIYTELYNTVTKKDFIYLNNAQSYVIGIARNKVNKYFSLEKNKLPFQLEDEKLNEFCNLNIDIENDLITKDNVIQVWNYLKHKSQLASKIFYLYYVMDFSIKTIAKDLEMTESNVKNLLYRTKKALQEKFKKGDDFNVK